MLFYINNKGEFIQMVINLSSWFSFNQIGIDRIISVEKQKGIGMILMNLT